MKHAPEIAHDAERCEALRSLSILDSEPEARFDRLTRLAQQLFQVEIALVSLVDEQRQWFKSRQGLDATETKRSISFCGHAIEQDRIFVIEDTHADERFSDNPLVTDGPRIRFYAGCPLKGPGGYLMGTLCIIDPRPRRFDDQDRDALRVLAELAEAELREPVSERGEAGGSGVWLQAHKHLKRMRDRVSHPFSALAMAVLLSLTIIGLAVLWDREQLNSEVDQARNDAYHDASLVLGKLENALNARLHLVYALSGQVHASPEVDDASFQRFAEQLAHQISFIRSLQLAPDGVVEHVWPLKANQQAIGHDLMADPARRAAAQDAIVSRSMWLSGPIDLIQGGRR